MSSESGLQPPPGVASAQIADSLGGRGVVRGGIRSRTPGRLLAGPVYTVQIPAGDNLGLHRAIRAAEPGDVIVAAVEGSRDYGLWGELMTAAAARAGLGGLVTDGSIRDVADISASGFPVFSAGVDIRAARKDEPGIHRVPVELGGVRVAPGDYVIGDDDGLVVVAAADLGDCLARAAEIATREGHLLQAIEGGASLFELLGLDAADGHGGDGQ